MAKKKRDAGHEETEKVLAELEKEISKEYEIAEREVQEKLDKYIQSFTRKNEAKLKLVQAGQMTQDEYNKWLYGQLAMGDRWKDLKDVLAQDFTNASQIAKSVAFGHMPEVYAINHDYGTYQVENMIRLDTDYVLYNHEAAERLFKGGKFYHNPGKLLTASINAGKTKAWNKRQIQSVMMQSILQGEGAYKVAKRLAKAVGERNRASDIRNARTMTTYVQNAGREDSYKRAEKMGVDLEKEWLAIMDGKTRHEHRLLDGQHVPVDEKFEVEGYEIDCPGDPEAEGFLIYNCRCTLLPRLARFNGRSNDEPIHQGNPALGDMTYEEWKHDKYYKQAEEEILNGG